MSEANNVQVDPVDVSAGERKDLLDLVEEKGRDRAHRKLPKGQVPKILLPYQQRWHTDLSVVRFCVKSRRIGFSWGCIAAEGALEAARVNGMSQYYMGYNLGMAAENIGDALAFAEIYGVAASSIDVTREREVLGERKQDITKYKLTFASGHVYEALSSAPWNWRGRQGHARIDEAAHHRDLAETIKGALAFRLWGGRVDIISTHDGEENPFNLLDLDIVAGKLPWSRHHIDFDRALAEGLYKRICLVTGKTWSPEAERDFRDEAFADYPDQADANEELLCIPKRGSGAYIPRILLENCHDKRIPIVRLGKPADYVLNPDRIDETRRWLADAVKPVIDNLPGQRSVYGQDFGRDGDLSVIWVLQEDGPGHWRQAFSLELRRLPFDVQALIRDYVLSNIPLLHHAKFDARGNGQSHAEGALQKFGAQRVECVKATAEWYSTWFPKYKAAYEDKSITVNASEDVIADHRRVVQVKGRPTMDDGRDKGSDGEYRHGDSAVAGLLAWAATHQEGQPPAGASIDSTADAYAPEAARGRRRAHMFR
jgi:phage FluMu gp28-like protein